MPPAEPDLADALERRADLLGDQVAIVQGATNWTWVQFDDAAARLAGYLSTHGVRAGDRVAIGATNCPEYLVALYGAAKLRAVPVNVNFRYRQQELEYVLRDSGAIVLVHDSMLASVVGAARINLPALRVVISISPESEVVDGAVPFASALAHEPITRSEAVPDLPWILYTGGTTGAPKAVVQPHNGGLMALMEAQAYAPRGLVGPTSNEDVEPALRRMAKSQPIQLVAPPLMHGTGVYGALTTLLAGGMCVLLPSRRFDAVEYLGFVTEHQVTELLIVGDAFGRPLADALDAAVEAGQPFDVSSVRWVRSAGVVWSSEVKARMLVHLDATLVDAIAATEGGPYAISLSDRRTPFCELSTFRLAAGARVLLPGTGMDAAPGEPGYLAAPSPIGTRYAGDPARTAEVYRSIDGVLYSVPGDLVRVDDAGVVTFLGRGGGVINTGGEKVYPSEVEEALRSHTDVTDAVVVGVPDRRWGEVVMAVVVPAPGAELNTIELQNYVASVQADYKKPRRIVAVPELRRTAAGKADLGWIRTVLERTENP